MASLEIIPGSRHSKKLFVVSNDTKDRFISILGRWAVSPVMEKIDIRANLLNFLNDDLFYERHYSRCIVNHAIAYYDATFMLYLLASFITFVVKDNWVQRYLFRIVPVGTLNLL